MWIEDRQDGSMTVSKTCFVKWSFRSIGSPCAWTECAESTFIWCRKENILTTKKEFSIINMINFFHYVLPYLTRDGFRRCHGLELSDVVDACDTEFALCERFSGVGSCFSVVEGFAPDENDFWTDSFKIFGSLNESDLRWVFFDCCEFAESLAGEEIRYRLADDENCWDFWHRRIVLNALFSVNMNENQLCTRSYTNSSNNSLAKLSTRKCINKWVETRIAISQPKTNWENNARFYWC